MKKKNIDGYPFNINDFHNLMRNRVFNFIVDEINEVIEGTINQMLENEDILTVCRNQGKIKALQDIIGTITLIEENLTKEQDNERENYSG